MTYVGIDVSKAIFVVAYSSAKSSETITFSNTVKGIKEFIKTISPEENHNHIYHNKDHPRFSNEHVGNRYSTIYFL